MTGKEVDLADRTAVALQDRRVLTMSNVQASWARGERVSADPSSNHACLGMNADLVNLCNHHPIQLPEDKQAQKARLYFDGPLFSKESLTRIHYHTWNAEPYRTARVLWSERGRTDLVSSAYEACRAYIAVLALGAEWVTCRSLTQHAHETPGPACITADGPKLAAMNGYPSVTCCGARSAVNVGFSRVGGEKHWIGWLPSGAQYNLREAAKGIADSRYGRALKARGYSGTWLTPQDAEIVNAAINDDPAALKTLLEWASKRPMSRPFRIIRTTEGAATINLVGPQSSKATLYACAVWKDSGIHKFLVCENGGPDTGAGDDDVEPGTAVVADDLSSVTAQRDSKNLPAATMPLPGGTVLVDVTIGTDVADFLVRVPRTVVPPPPPPPQPPPARKKNWFQKFLEWLGIG